MKTGKRTKLFTALLAGVCALTAALSLNSATASANSANRYWEGVTSSGTVLMDGQCPLEVEHENLIFNIVPPVYTEGEGIAVSTVTAEYYFYNPADYDVSATLVFPFGLRPNYNLSDDEYAAEVTKYDVTVDGEKAEKTLRHTYYSGEFDIDVDMARLTDGYIDDGFLRSDLTVTAYCYTVDGISASDAKNKAPYAAFTFTESQTRRVMTENSNGGQFKDGRISIGGFVKNNDSLIIYALGEPFAETPQWNIYENGGCVRTIDGSVNFKHTQTFTFEELAFSCYPASGEISRTDWYNAVVECLNERQSYTPSYMGNIGYLDLTYSLMRWYEYELNVPAGGRLINTVTAPIYPSANYAYDPTVYGYNYLVSPAKTWASFGSLDIVVKTEMFMTDNCGFDFEKAEGGYVLSLDGLPEGELSFFLSSSENPVFVPYGGGWAYSFVFYWWIWLLIAIVCVAAAVGAFFGVRRLIRKRNSRGGI